MTFGTQATARWSFLAGTFVALGFFFHAMFERSHFQPDPAADSPTQVLAGLGAVAWMRYQWVNPGPDNKLRALPAGKLLVVFPAMLGFAYFVCWFAISLGAADLLTTLAGRQFVEVVRVENKLPERSGRGCHHRIQIGATPQWKPEAVCVPQGLWSAVEPGTPMRATFRTSPLGTKLLELDKGI